MDRTSVEVGAPEQAGKPDGFDPATSTEDVSQRSADKQVFVNTDGTRTLRKYQTRRFYQAPDGSWQPIDSTLTADGGTWRTRADSDTKRFATKANADDVASVQLDGDTSVEFGMSGAAAVNGQVSGDAVTYPEARPGADLELQATPLGAKETITLKSKDSPTVWEFPLHLDGLTASLTGQGAVELKDSAGVVQSSIPPGFMEDSAIDPLSGEGARSTAVRYALVGDAANPVLRVSADPAWLADPARVFPVKIDPTVQKNTNGTTYVMSPYNADYSGDPNLSVGTYNGGGNVAAAYLKFDSVSADLAGEYVLGAKLWMYETYSYSCDAREIIVSPVTQGWSVGGNKTYPGPGYGGEVARGNFSFGHDASCGSRWTWTDLGEAGRAMVQGWTHGQPNNGITVRASDTDSYAWKKFASAASANPPYLEVTFTAYWATYSVGAMNPIVTSSTDGKMAVTVTNGGRDTWGPGNNYKLGYRIWDGNGNELPDSYTAWTPMPYDVPPGATVTVNATVKALPPGSYTIRWDMDNVGYGRFSWENVPMSVGVTMQIPNQVPVIDSMSPPSNFVSTTLTPTLALTGHDLDTYPGTGLDYHFRICEVTNSANCQDTNFIDSPVWSVPAGWMQWGKDYVWYGSVGDHNAPSPWSVGSYLSTRVPQPAITSHLSSVDGGGVDPGVGNYTTPVTDAVIAAAGPALSVVRSYNSLDPRRNNAFGEGWSTVWDTRLVPDNDGSGNVVITSADGRQSRYGRNPDGSFAAPPGQFATLLAVSGGGWTLRLKDGTRYAFNATGRLNTVTDAVGRAQSLSYDTGGKLVTATDTTSGRSLTFTWTGNHVTAVTTHPDPELTWSYTYDGDKLAEACDAEQACTTYEYDTGSHYRSVTLDANPRAYWRLSEASGTKSVSEVPGFWGTADGTATNLAYGQPGPLAGSPTTAAGFNGASSVVRMPDNLVRNSNYIAIELWFQTTSTAGGVLFSTGNDLPGAANPGGSMPVLYVGTDGKLHGHLWNGQVDGITTAGTVTDGAWHHVVLSGALNTQTLYLDGASVGTLSGTLANIDPYDFVGAGAVSTRAWPARPTNNWGYFTGSVAEVSLYHQPMGPTTVAEHYAARAQSDALKTITRPGGTTAATVSYNATTDRVAQYTDADGGTYSYTAPAVEGDGFRYATSVTDSTPDAYYRLNEASGTSADGQAQLARASYVRGTGGTAPGPYDDGHSQWFDGTTSYVRLPDDELNGNRQASVEMWFQTQTTTGGVLFATGNNLPGDANPSGAMPVLYVGTDGKLYGHFWNGNANGIVTASPVNDGAWHHVVLTGNNDTQTLYLDGGTVGTATGTISNADPYAFVGVGAVNDQPWPAKPAGTWGYLAGSISQVALYSQSLSAAEVTAHYAPDTRAAYLAAVKTSGPHALWGLEDPDASQWAVNDAPSGTYNNVSLAAAPALRGAAAAGFNGSSSYVNLAERQVRGRTRVSVEMWFQTSATTGGVLYATGNDLPGSTSSPGGAMPVLYVGTDGKLYGHFWNGNANGIVTPAVVNDGAWHHVALSGEGDTQSMYLDGNLVGTVSGQIETIDRYDFVGAGSVTSLAWPAKPSNSWGYFSGSIGEVAIYHRPLDSASVANHYSAKVAAYGVHVTDPASQTTTYSYDPTRGGRLVSSTAPNGGTRVLGYDTGGYVNRITDENGHTTVLANDSRGNALSRTTCRDGQNGCYTQYRSYYLNASDPLDPRNDKVTEDRDARSESATDDRFLTTYNYTATGDIESVGTPGATWGAQRWTGNTYTDGTGDAVGGGVEPAGLLASTTNPEGGTTWYGYNSAGDLAQSVDTNGLLLTYGYDGIGRKIVTKVSATDRDDEDVTVFSYDGNSRQTGQLDPATTNAVTGVAHERRTTWVYNPDGTLDSSTVDDLQGNDPARTTSYTYDDHARVHTTTDPAGGVVTTDYDAFGAVTRTVDQVGNETTATYTDARHQLATTTIKGFTGDGGAARDVVLESRAYDPAGRLASVTDAMGRTTAYTYYDDNLLAGTTLLGYHDPATGQNRDLPLTSYTYSGTGKAETTTTGDGRYSTTTGYDNGDRAISSTDRDGDTVLRSANTTVDDLDNATRVTVHNADGTTAADIETAYDDLGNEISTAVHTSDSDTLLSTTTRDPRGMPLSTVDPRGNLAGSDPAAFTTSYTYDALGQTVTTTQPPVAAETNGQQATTVAPATTTGYNTFGEAVDVRDPNNNVTHTDYDPAGRATTITLPTYTAPGSTTPTVATRVTGYDLAGRVTSTTDGRGNTTTYGYDQLGNLRRKTDPPALLGQAGGTWIATYDPLGEALSTSDPSAAQTFATYDQLGNQITSTVVERVPAPTRNLTTHNTYDTLGNLVSTTTPTGVTTQATYDDHGNQLSTTNAAGKTTTTRYNALDAVTAVTDPLGTTTNTGYDQAGRATSQSDVDSHGTVLRTAAAGYDGAGNQTSTTDALHATTTSVFDAANRLTAQTRPVSATESITTSYGYDAAGNITRFTDGNNHTTVYTSNAWNLPESTIEPATAQTPNAADRTYTTTYDRDGETATLTKPGGVTITTAYDALGNVTKQTGTGASVATPDRVFGYDAVGHLTSTSAPGGTNTYTYDDRGNLTSATGPSGNSSATYDYDNRLASANTTAGTTAYGYDTAGRLATAADPLTGITATYGYDDADNVTTIGYGAGNATRSLGYDALSRLTSDTLKSPTGTTTASATYGYDTENHLISQTTTGVAGAGANTYGYDQAGRLASWTSGNTTTDYGWDGAGNLTRDGPDTATYNERNQLTSKGATNYSYTARGTLATRTTNGAATNLAFNAYDELTSDGATTNTYDALDRLITTGNSALTYGGTGQTITSDGAADYTYTPGGELLGTGQPGAGSLAITNVHTDLTTLANPYTAAVTGSRTYDPLGDTTATSGTQTALGYQHQYTDSGAGTVNMGSRWYDPDTGGFTSRDTIGIDPRDQNNNNRYTYAAGDPLTNTDPSGRFIAPIIVIPILEIAGEDALAVALQQALRSAARRAAGSILESLLGGNSVGSYYKSPKSLNGRIGLPGGYISPLGGPYIEAERSTSPARCRTNCSNRSSAPTKPKENQLSPEQLRQLRVMRDALTPHARPVSTPTISQAIVDAFNSSFSAPLIDLGVLDSTVVNGGDVPYDPERLTEISQPGALPSASGQLESACAEGGLTRSDGSRTSQVWTCGELNGSGPVPGVIEVSGRVKSVKAFQNYAPSGKNMIEYVFDPVRNIFAVGGPLSYLDIDGSPHQRLARSIGADETRVLGGMFSRGSDGRVNTNEYSGHYGDRWTPDLRRQFTDFMGRYGIDIAHEAW
ncbi:type IV secretion protein Rhs [Amycolatopsis acidicola]|uniref:Type IV secretion protein Rhs n=1 Tax=Amycolatopsis acidicola TaxID=2596893 RepID=A0A5N0VC67_9PSEU|nr:LamG-like jellyroll fold domain-containing protein [Amycolatopsis acidicola]KAA9163969.1 type IV secretion protein Rhs [Amycolatopsis acidicola]